MSGNVDEDHLVRACDMPGPVIEFVYLPGDGGPAPSGRKRRDAPIGDGKHKDMFRPARRKMNGLPEKALELGGIFFGRTAPVLIIYPDEQGNDVVRGKEAGAGKGTIQLIRCPACAGDDLGRGENIALPAEELDGLVRISFKKRDSFTDGVGIP